MICPVEPSKRPAHTGALWGARRLGVTLAALALTACAPMTPRLPNITIPESLRSKCEKPTPESVQTIGDLAAFSLRQNAMIEVCDARREAVVSIVDGYNGAVKTKRKLFGVF